MKKWIKYSLLAVLVLILLAGVTLAVCLDSLIRSGTEFGMKTATLCETKLDKASLGIFSGSLKLHGLDVKNPQGFDQTWSFLKFGATEVQVQPTSLMSDKIEVGEVTLKDLEVSYIQPSEGKANYEVVIDNATRFLPKKDPNDPNAPKEEPKEKSPSNKAIHVGVINFTGAKVHALVEIAGAPVKVTLPLPNFKLENINVKGGMPELTAELVKGIGAQLVEQAPEIAKAAAESLKGNVKELTGGAIEQGKGVVDAVKGIKNPFKK